MNAIQESEITAYIEKNIPDFHQNRINKLKQLRLKPVLLRKNPYLFRVKHLNVAADLVKSLLDAYLSSQEETLFGAFLEGLAIHLCGMAFGGRKSSTQGIDLEFNRDGIHYIVSIKSGPNWANSGQIARMRQNFQQAKRILGTSRSRVNVVAVNGCCYGRETVEEKDGYIKKCGQSFWAFISGDQQLYARLVQPLGHRAKEHNEQFAEQYAKVLNQFSLEFIKEFCLEDGAVDWDKLLAFNSGEANA